MNGESPVAAISERLQKDGFAISTAHLADEQVVSARRARFHRWTLTRLHIFVFLFEPKTLNRGAGEALLSTSRAFALANKGGLRPGLQTGIANMPVLIADSVSEEATWWARERRQSGRVAVLDFPVVVDIASGDSAYLTDTPLWGWAYFGWLRAIAESDIAEPVREMASASQPHR